MPRWTREDAHTAQKMWEAGERPMSGWEQRNADFCKAQLDAEFVYIEAERRVKALEDENAKLRELVRGMWLYDYAGKFSSAQEDVEHVAMVYQRMRELGVDA